MTSTITGADAARLTPPDRDRYVDALRIGSLLVVVLGHWLMATVSIDGEVGNALVVVEWLKPVTWVLQVMPLFFLVGGVAHSHALASLRRRAAVGRRGSYAAFVRARAGRLLRPTCAFLLVWLAVGLLAHPLGWTAPAGEPPTLLQTALGLVTQLLWFVGIYLGVAALAPVMHAAHRRWGWAVVTVLAAGAVSVDVLRFTGAAPALGTLNFALVWLALHQLRFLWHDGQLGRRTAAGMAAGGFVVLVSLVTVGPYPVSMVGLPGEAVSNMAPPTVALLCQGIAVVGVAVLARGPAERALARPRVWRAVVTAGGLAMTVFLWHLTALFLGVFALRLLGLEPPSVGSGWWWATRPVWILALGVLALGLVLVFRRFDAPRPAPGGVLVETTQVPDVFAACGAAATVVGVLMVSITGVDVLAGHAVRFVAADVTPGFALVLLAVGIVLLLLAAPRRAAIRVDASEPTSSRSTSSWSTSSQSTSTG